MLIFLLRRLGCASCSVRCCSHISWPKSRLRSFGRKFFLVRLIVCSAWRAIASREMLVLLYVCDGDWVKAVLWPWVQRPGFCSCHTSIVDQLTEFLVIGERNYAIAFYVVERMLEIAFNPAKKMCPNGSQIFENALFSGASDIQNHLNSIVINSP